MRMNKIIEGEGREQKRVQRLWSRGHREDACKEKEEELRARTGHLLWNCTLWKLRGSCTGGLLTTWLSIQALNKDDTNRHAMWKAEISWGTNPKQRTAANWGTLRGRKLPSLRGESPSGYSVPVVCHKITHIQVTLHRWFRFNKNWRRGQKPWLWEKEQCKWRLGGFGEGLVGTKGRGKWCNYFLRNEKVKEIQDSSVWYRAWKVGSTVKPRTRVRQVEAAVTIARAVARQGEERLKSVICQADFQMTD